MICTHTVSDAFSGVDCDRILDLVAGAPANDARLVGRQRDHNLRRADLVWLDDLPGTGWVMDRIVDLVRRANRAVFDFDLSEFAESPQVARYGAEREGHFDWHADIGDGPLAARRKLTMVVQLSDPETYRGGALEIMPSAAVVTAAARRGAATLFPAFLLHRVTPVTGGARHSLTVWAHGPAFR
ncbi:2OG-Fe(II) oxygenase [Roseivivax isoporae]|uniref:Oxidoreductase n=1 Tax=Roseivivax isoporae LMG 25204 TaxID=1449351 RepID=X7FB32_9RHOB|nr:2OG-Fe(II) oxygenase [Roseivivax isoporae]ETX29928.1 oxidoreductase [Roseivivax isoporae LMG 25204]